MLFKSYVRYTKDHSRDIFEEATYKAYLNEAKSFIRLVVGVDVSSIKTKKQLRNFLSDKEDVLIEHLKIVSYQKSSNAWRKLRRSLVVTYRAAGLSKQANFTGAIKNPSPLFNRTRNKNKRMIKVDNETYKAILKDRVDNKDIDASLLIILCKNLGIRPCEAKYLEIVKVNAESITVYIKGAKKTLAGKKDKSKKRGIDRLIQINYKKSVEYALLAALNIDDKRIKSAQMRISRASKRLFPKSKVNFCLYSLRYQFGSDLKKALTVKNKESRKKIAAIMGHKNTSSISSYGHSLSGNSAFKPPKIHAKCLVEINDNYDSKQHLTKHLELNLPKEKTLSPAIIDEPSL